LVLAHFLSQCAVESINFTAMRENLNYSAAALLKTFPTHFIAAEANAYARQPERIANRAYANRIGNGNEASGDGWKYRGRGYIQLTGKANYQDFSHFMTLPEIVTNPDLVATDFPLTSAGYFFNSRHIVAIAKKGATDAVVEEVSKAINGGLNGIADRKAQFHIYNQLLSPQPPEGGVFD
jgi:putative chitinase